MRKEYEFNHVRLTISYERLNDLYRIKFNKLDRIVDFDKGYSVKFIKDRGRIKLFELSDSVKNKEQLIESMRSNPEFMSELQNIVNIIQKFMRPKSLDVSDIFGDGFIINDNPLVSDEVRLVWDNEDREIGANKLTIISIL